MKRKGKCIRFFLSFLNSIGPALNMTTGMKRKGKCIRFFLSFFNSLGPALKLTAEMKIKGKCIKFFLCFFLNSLGPAWNMTKQGWRERENHSTSKGFFLHPPLVTICQRSLPRDQSYTRRNAMVLIKTNIGKYASIAVQFLSFKLPKARAGNNYILFFYLLYHQMCIFVLRMRETVSLYIILPD